MDLDSWTVLRWPGQNIENENVIARVGNCELTTFDYSKTYSEKILNTGIVDSDLERERHLNQLIRLKLFADASIRDDIALDSLSNKLLQIDSIKIIKDELWLKGHSLMNGYFEKDKMFFKDDYLIIKKE